jgi:molybdate transport repressor ModE-like protein
MKRVSIKPVWTVATGTGASLSPRLLELLSQVNEHGSLAGACRQHGASYRHAWNLVRQGEQLLGVPLLSMARGRGSVLTPLGEKLVWAGHRIGARLSPMLESLASELEVEIGRVLSGGGELLRVHASHGFAVEKLLDDLVGGGVTLERKYVGTQEALASLQDGQCDLAGFHVPEGRFEPLALAHYRPWLQAGSLRVVHVATRQQGLMIAPGNPLKIRDVRDLARPGVRFVNRQRGSGTRFLFECLLEEAGVDAARIPGYEQGEYTHAAVAAYVASGMADAGFGLETPARRFRLGFVPLATERYLLLCHEAALAQPQMQALLQVLRGTGYRQAVGQLPGYSPSRCGEVEVLAHAFPKTAQRRQARRGPAGTPRAKGVRPRTHAS